MKTDFNNLEFLHPLLRKLLNYVEMRYGFEFTETSSYRMDGDGVHTTLPVRGFDIRCWDMAVGKLICDQINQVWKYDPTRPGMHCAMYHNVGRGAHIHLQIHPNTVQTQ